jgi:hypothetical protein
VIITILRFIIVSITWFISTLPFLIPYHILLTSQNKKIGYKLSIKHIVIVYIFVYYLTGVLDFTGIPTILRDVVHISKLQDKVSVQITNIEKIPLLLREEACFYMASAFAGMCFVYNPLLIYPILRSLFH